MTDQTIILNWFIKQREDGNHDFFSVKLVLKCLEEEGILTNGNTRNQINRLYAYGYLDVINPSAWKRRFRVRDKYVKGYYMED